MLVRARDVGRSAAAMGYGAGCDRTAFVVDGAICGGVVGVDGA